MRSDENSRTRSMNGFSSTEATESATELEDEDGESAGKEVLFCNPGCGSGAGGKPDFVRWVALRAFAFAKARTFLMVA